MLDQASVGLIVPVSALRHRIREDSRAILLAIFVPSARRSMRLSAPRIMQSRQSKGSLESSGGPEFPQCLRVLYPSNGSKKAFCFGSILLSAKDISKSETTTATDCRRSFVPGQDHVLNWLEPMQAYEESNITRHRRGSSSRSI